jgi:hypothetical protein
MIWSGRKIEQHDFSYLEKGWYILKIENENVVRSFKLIK